MRVQVPRPVQGSSEAQECARRARSIFWIRVVERGNLSLQPLTPGISRMNDDEFEDDYASEGDDNQATIEYVYEFLFDNGSRKEFRIQLDYETLNIINEPLDEYPEWTELEYCKCPNCPLEEDEHPQCPVAKALWHLIDAFKDVPSDTETTVQVHTKARTYIGRTKTERGVSAILGLMMASSGCPVLGRLKPMVETHLPFATPDETTYRILAMYLMGQYFAYRRGERADWELEELLDFFEEVQTVNVSFCNRLQGIDSEGASVNAVAILEDMANFTGFLIQSDELGRLEGIFGTLDKHRY